MDNKAGFRHELKFLMTEQEAYCVRQRLKLLLSMDRHAGKEGYIIRSLYFDDRDESAYMEKLDGVNDRRKYRIRIYNMSDSVIRLECKEKQESYIRKTQAELTREEAEGLLAGNAEVLRMRTEPLCREFYHLCLLHGMRPAVVVDYDREPYVYPYGDVRITFDSHIRAGMLTNSLFDKELPTTEVLPEGQLVMEVKYTQFLPQVLRDILTIDNTVQTAASKYVMCMEKRLEYTGRIR